MRNLITVRKYFLWSSSWYCDYHYYRLLFYDLKINEYLEGVFRKLNFPTSTFIITRSYGKMFIRFTFMLRSILNNTNSYRSMVFFIKRNRYLLGLDSSFCLHSYYVYKKLCRILLSSFFLEKNKINSSLYRLEDSMFIWENNKHYFSNIYRNNIGVNKFNWFFKYIRSFRNRINLFTIKNLIKETYKAYVSFYNKIFLLYKKFKFEYYSNEMRYLMDKFRAFKFINTNTLFYWHNIFLSLLKKIKDKFKLSSKVPLRSKKRIVYIFSTLYFKKISFFKKNKLKLSFLNKFTRSRKSYGYEFLHYKKIKPLFRNLVDDAFITKSKIKSWFYKHLFYDHVISRRHLISTYNVWGRTVMKKKLFSSNLIRFGSKVVKEPLKYGIDGSVEYYFKRKRINTKMHFTRKEMGFLEKSSLIWVKKSRKPIRYLIKRLSKKFTLNYLLKKKILKKLNSRKPTSWRVKKTINPRRNVFLPFYKYKYRRIKKKIVFKMYSKVNNLFKKNYAKIYNSLFKGVKGYPSLNIKLNLNYGRFYNIVHKIFNYTQRELYSRNIYKKDLSLPIKTKDDSKESYKQKMRVWNKFWNNRIFYLIKNSIVYSNNRNNSSIKNKKIKNKFKETKLKKIRNVASTHLNYMNENKLYSLQNFPTTFYVKNKINSKYFLNIFSNYFILFFKKNKTFMFYFFLKNYYFLNGFFIRIKKPWNFYLRNFNRIYFKYKYLYFFSKLKKRLIHLAVCYKIYKFKKHKYLTGFFDKFSKHLFRRGEHKKQLRYIKFYNDLSSKDENTKLILYKSKRFRKLLWEHIKKKSFFCKIFFSQYRVFYNYYLILNRIYNLYKNFFFLYINYCSVSPLKIRILKKHFILKTRIKYSSLSKKFVILGKLNKKLKMMGSFTLFVFLLHNLIWFYKKKLNDNLVLPRNKKKKIHRKVFSTTSRFYSIKMGRKETKTSRKPIKLDLNSKLEFRIKIFSNLYHSPLYSSQYLKFKAHPLAVKRLYKFNRDFLIHLPVRNTWTNEFKFLYKQKSILRFLNSRLLCFISPLIKEKDIRIVQFDHGFDFDPLPSYLERIVKGENIKVNDYFIKLRDKKHINYTDRNLLNQIENIINVQYDLKYESYLSKKSKVNTHPYPCFIRFFNNTFKYNGLYHNKYKMFRRNSFSPIRHRFKKKTIIKSPFCLLGRKNIFIDNLYSKGIFYSSPNYFNYIPVEWHFIEHVLPKSYRSINIKIRWLKHFLNNFHYRWNTVKPFQKKHKHAGVFTKLEQLLRQYKNIREGFDGWLKKKVLKSKLKNKMLLQRRNKKKNKNLYHYYGVKTSKLDFFKRYSLKLNFSNFFKSRWILNILGQNNILSTSFYNFYCVNINSFFSYVIFFKFFNNFFF